MPRSKKFFSAYQKQAVHRVPVWAGQPPSYLFSAHRISVTPFVGFLNSFFFIIYNSACASDIYIYIYNLLRGTSKSFSVILIAQYARGWEHVRIVHALKGQPLSYH